MKLSIYNLHYSSVLGIPVVGEVLYIIQIFGIQLGVLHSCWISKKDVGLRQRLFGEVTHRADFLFVFAWQLGSQLITLRKRYVLAYQGKILAALSLAQLYDLQLAVLHAQSVTSESLKFLNPLLPSNYPIWRTYILSVRDSLETQCDFIQQTLSELLARNAAIVLFSHVPQKSRPFPEKKYQYLDGSLPKWGEITPYFFGRFLRRTWQKWLQMQLFMLCQKLHSPVCWCFDPDDIMTVSYCPAGTLFLYDCVDYHTSLNSQLKERIDQDKKAIILKSDVVVTNSRTLLKKLRKLRADVQLVPQGFDHTAFQLQTQMKLTQQKFFQQLRHAAKSFPIVTYLGVLSWRIDYLLLQKIIQQLPQLKFCLPSTTLKWQTEDEQTQWYGAVEQLHTLPNILWYPHLQRDEVVKMLEKSTVGIIPYDMFFEFNQYCFPMKLFEYFYQGLPVLSTPIEELKYYTPYVQVARTAAEWKKQLSFWTKKEPPSLWKKEMRDLCDQQSWQKKVDLILRKLTEYQRYGVQ